MSAVRTWVSQLFPRVRESTSSDAFRLSGKLTAILLSLMYSTNAVWFFGPKVPYFNYAIQYRAHAVNAPLVLAAIGIGLIVWQKQLSLIAYRRLTYASLTLVVLSAHLTSWTMGNLSTLIGMHFALI